MLRFSLQARLGHFQLAADGSLPSDGIAAIFGPSGSGKSVFLRGLAGLLRLPNGQVQFHQDIWQSAQHWVPVERRRVGLILQQPSLLPHLSAYDNLVFGYQRTKERRLHPQEVIERLHLEALMHQPVSTLSGGQRQRLVLARALLASPRLLLLDEPISALDRSARFHALREIREIHLDWRIPMIYVSHDAEELERIADTVSLMDRGKLQPAQSVFDVCRDVNSPLRSDLGPSILADGELVPPDASNPLWRVRCGAWVLNVPAPRQIASGSVRVRIAARDIGLACQVPLNTSFQNIESVYIRDIQAIRAGTVLVYCQTPRGQDLLAEITEHSAQSLGLHIGQSMQAIFKAAALVY